MVDPGSSDTRNAIESKIAFLERTIDDLSDVILAQGRTLDELASRMARLEARLHEAQDAAGTELDPLEERPPHH